MDGNQQHNRRQVQREWDTIRSYRKDFGKDLESFDNALMLMFGYIDDDHKMAENILSPSLGRFAKNVDS